MASKMAICEEAEGARDLDRIVEMPRRNVGLTDQCDARPGTTNELPFHCGQRHRLMLADHFCLLVPRWKRNEKRGNQARDSPGAQVHFRLLEMDSAQGVERAKCSHDERT